MAKAQNTSPWSDNVKVPKHLLRALVQQVVVTLESFPHDPGLNELREALGPVEELAYPELRDRTTVSKT